MAADGRPAGEIAEMLEGRATGHADVRRGRDPRVPQEGRPDQRRPGGDRQLLSVKPIIRVNAGVVDTVDRVRTRGKARERLIELICERPIERLAILHTISPDVEAFRDEVVARAAGVLDAADVSINLVGASVGPHLGPGCVGAAVLYRA